VESSVFDFHKLQAISIHERASELISSWTTKEPIDRKPSSNPAGARDVYIMIPTGWIVLSRYTLKVVVWERN
jgi:hypothetical protein